MDDLFIIFAFVVVMAIVGMLVTAMALYPKLRVLLDLVTGRIELDAWRPPTRPRDRKSNRGG